MTDTSRVKVGMVMTTYSTGGHRSELALHSIRSLLQNTNMENRHLVIVDDASTDGHGEALRREFSNDERISLLMRDRNMGVGLNKRDGIQMVLNNSFLAPMFLYICDDDLTYQPGWMEYALQMFLDLEMTQNVGMFGIWRHRCHTVLENYPFRDDPRYTMLRVAELPGCCVFMRPSVYGLIGGWDKGREEDKRGDDLATTAAVRRLGMDLFAVTPPLVIHEGMIYPNGEKVCYQDEQEAENREWIKIQD